MSPGGEARHVGETPSPWIERWADLVPPASDVLDVACGYGRHARYFAMRHCRVIAVDRDEAALATLVGIDGVLPVRADLEQSPWPFAPRRFDAIVVANYLHRPLLPHFIAGLRPQGVLLYETFMAGNSRFGKPANPHFLLRVNELFEAVAGELEVLAFEQGYIKRPKAAVVQRLCAVRGNAEYVTICSEKIR